LHKDDIVRDDLKKAHPFFLTKDVVGGQLSSTAGRCKKQDSPPLKLLGQDVLEKKRYFPATIVLFCSATHPLKSQKSKYPTSAP
jgi:hypothetical protein